MWGSAADFACLRDGASSGKASGQVADDHSTRRKPGLAKGNEPRGHSNTNIGSTSPGTEETHGDNTEMRHDVHHFGKARIPSDTHAQTIVTELAQISFTDGKNRGRTFEEVWNNDHDNSYKNWLQKRLHDIDIVYPAFVVYAELMESLQRRPSWRVHQNQ